MESQNRSKVAVVGSGMAGLVTAYLLKQDPQRRYDVEIFESGREPSLDFASVSVPDPHTGKIERVDVPMRAFTEGYYHNLKAMYDFLGIGYKVQPFLFSFSRFTNHRETEATGLGDEKQYLIHASNNHRLPPIKPKAIALVPYLGELLFALICYVWFSLCCLFVPTRQDRNEQPCESFDQYLRRIRLPRYFVRYFLLPLMSAITTCPHKVLLDFPAKDIIDYKKCITSGRQLTVSAGVNEVQRRLLKGIPVHCSSQVMSVEPQSEGIRIRWRKASNDQTATVQDRVFDKVVLAVPPNVVGAVFAPLRKEMDQIPTIPVKTIVHRDMSGMTALNRSLRDRAKGTWFVTEDAKHAHVIHLRTVGGSEAQTEATHVQPSGVMVTSCPLTKRDQSKIVSNAGFTRVLRTPVSRSRVNRIFGMSSPNSHVTDEKQVRPWTNGDDGVYLVGSWCWDGMVLLEGCVVSAIRTAKTLGVQVPWEGTM